jgi:hypothetical protein
MDVRFCVIHITDKKEVDGMSAAVDVVKNGSEDIGVAGMELGGGDGGCTNVDNKGRKKGNLHGPNPKKVKKNLQDKDRPRCQFFLKEKDRFCRLNPLKSNIFCGEHIEKDKVIAGKKRIPCPYNPNQ